MKAYDHIAAEWSKFRKNPISALYAFLPYLKADAVVLEAGCGNGRNLAEIAKHCRQAYGIDSSQQMVLQARKKLGERKGEVKESPITLLQADIRKLPFPDEMFDAVFCLAVLHHIKPREQGKALRELARVLKSGGLLLCSVWNKKHPKLVSLGKASGKPALKSASPGEMVAWTKKSGKEGDRYYYFFELDELGKKAAREGFSVERLFFERKGKQALEAEAFNLCLVARKKISG